MQQSSTTLQLLLLKAVLMNWVLTHTHQIGSASTGTVEMLAKPARSADWVGVVAAAVVVLGDPPSAAAFAGALDSAGDHPLPGLPYSCTCLPYYADSGAPAKIIQLVAFSYHPHPPITYLRLSTHVMVIWYCHLRPHMMMSSAQLLQRW